MANEENIKKHQFKKGQSGNPAGRPVGAFSRSSIAKRWLETLEKSKNPITGLYEDLTQEDICLLYTSPSPRDRTRSRMPSSA